VNLRFPAFVLGSEFLAVVARPTLVAVLLASSGIAHSGEDDPFVKWAAAHAVPVATLELNADSPDLLPLKSAIGSARVVGLGEPIHGAHEPLAFRNRLFRFLVEQMGFTAIALEWGFTEAIAVNSFAEDGAGEFESAALKDYLATIEEVELIRWMRDYNAAASLTGRRKIRLYGIDLTSGGRMGAPRLAMEGALAYLSKADPAAAQKIGASVGASLPRSDDREIGPVSTEALAGYGASVDALAEAMQANRKELIAHSSAEEYRRALRNLDVARQLAKCLPITPPPSADSSVWGAVHTCRDGAMAENVQWALENEGREGRLLVFAHNGHVGDSVWTGSRKSPFKVNAPMMGANLRRVYGDDLYIISTNSVMTSGEGLPKFKKIEDSIDNVLARVGPSRMFLDLRMARRTPAAFAWLSEPPPPANLDHYRVVTQSTEFDGFVFLRELTPAVELPTSD
jgi:erythromycin esterase